MKRLVVLFAVLLAMPTLVKADFQDGMRAFEKGDYELAFQEMKLAAELGDTTAKSALLSFSSMFGDGYAYGRGVPQNYAEAVKWYRRAAEQGSTEAKLKLGFIYAEGRGISAEGQGTPAAGRSVPQNYAEAEKWYRLAAEEGDVFAQVLLADLFIYGKGVPQNYAEAARWMRLAAEQGNASAQTGLGVMYDRGHGVPQDDAQAEKWYRLAAEQGNASAQYNLGTMYATGKGVPQDYVQAHMRFNLAAAAGDKNAVRARDLIAARMTPSQIAEAQRLAARGKVGKQVAGWSTLSRDDIKALQRALNAAGYDAGPADGVRGRRTEAALEAYQRHKGLPIGEPKLETLKELGLR